MQVEGFGSGNHAWVNLIQFLKKSLSEMVLIDYENIYRCFERIYLVYNLIQSRQNSSVELRKLSVEELNSLYQRDCIERDVPFLSYTKYLKESTD